MEGDGGRENIIIDIIAATLANTELTITIIFNYDVKR